MPLTAVMHREKNMLVTRNCKCFMLDRRSKQMCIKGKCIFAWSLHHIAWAEHVGIYDGCVQINRTWPQVSIPLLALALRTTTPLCQRVQLGGQFSMVTTRNQKRPKTMRMQGIVSDAGTTMKLVIGVTYLLECYSDCPLA